MVKEKMLNRIRNSGSCASPTSIHNVEREDDVLLILGMNLAITGSHLSIKPTTYDW